MNFLLPWACVLVILIVLRTSSVLGPYRPYLMRRLILIALFTQGLLALPLAMQYRGTFYAWVFAGLGLGLCAFSLGYTFRMRAHDRRQHLVKHRRAVKG